MTKLTLSVDEGVVAQAKRLAKQRGTSVSAMFSQLVRSMSQEDRGSQKLGPLARKASGLAAAPSNKPDREVLEEALLEKYGLEE